MSLFVRLKRIFVSLFIFSFFSLGMQNVANAAIVTSGDMMAAQQSQLDREQLKSWMAREDVREKLIDHGVDVTIT